MTFDTLQVKVIQLARPFAAGVRRFYGPPLLCLCILPSVWPLTTGGFFRSDDGILHLFRLHGLDDAIQQGILYPRLFPSFAFGYGHAVLAYYGPLSYYVGAVAHLLGADYPDALKWTIVAGFAGSGYSAYALARRFASPLPALVGAAVYVYFPYHLVLIYQRGALAEFMGWVFMPLILWGMTPVLDEPEAAVPRSPKASERPWLVSAVGIAALLFTHTLVALMFMPFAVIYGWLVNGGLAWEQRARRLALAVGIGLGLCALYWLPVVGQVRWVQLSAAAEGEQFIPWPAPTHYFIQDPLVFAYVR